MPSIYIINPAAEHASYYGFEVLDEADGGYVSVADLTTATLAGFVPEGWDIRLTDEAISPVDLDAQVDFVAITGKVSQRGRMIALAEGFRARGRTVLIGGPFASLSPQDMRPHADILVTGEIEEIADELFADLAAGRWQNQYNGGFADIRKSPIPRWDLYPVDRAQSGALQTTRGCPFNCEFCDVIQYQGRKQRHKDTDQILRELDQLHAVGFRSIFIVDDNFTVHRSWARAVLLELAAWNAARGDERVSFITQASLDIARDTEMLVLCREAGFKMFFMGVETINEASLREAGKRQNLIQPMHQAIDAIVGHGIGVHAGIILGFDHDSVDTFEEMRQFLQDSPLPEVAVGVLTAPQGTDLYHRLEREGRIDGPIWTSAIQGPFATNIVPALMPREDLVARTVELARYCFEPNSFEQRIMNFLAKFPASHVSTPRRTARARDPRSHMLPKILRYISSLGEAEELMVRTVLKAGAQKPGALPSILYFLSHYAQSRFYLDMDRGQLAKPGILPAPVNA
ncbi:radical SAM protein [Sphingomonas sp. R647]|uniref:radical SAM protein n=1 Tax=Sphingomonas sp. R647 TaxID=2875233 RepID=UPI001CD61935|nr:radical SAM protein [Sphingomonas sp. R647]MCA1196447.1 radical SAM protein [Sphingomonas sp. R647]